MKHSWKVISLYKIFLFKHNFLRIVVVLSKMGRFFVIPLAIKWLLRLNNVNMFISIGHIVRSKNYLYDNLHSNKFTEGNVMHYANDVN